MDSFKLMSLVFLFSFSFFFSCSSRVTKFSSRKSRFSEDFEKGSKFSNREVLKERLETRSEFLNIFLLPHSHCDAGWIKTFDEYYETEVVHILDSITKTLIEDPTKRFSWSEIGFFSVWFENQTKETKQKVAKLVANKQLEFIGGGWVQHDEAVTDYIADIDQMTEGHIYIFDNFGVTPEFGWQIDPFGASRETPSLFAQMGFNALVIDRIDINLQVQHEEEKKMQFVWLSNPSLLEEGEDVFMFTHELDILYVSPFGFVFEDWPPMGPSPPITPENIQERSDDLALQIDLRALAYPTSNILIPFGGDFLFQNASVEFNNMDKLINYINTNSDFYKMNLSYVTLSSYFKAMHSTNFTFKSYTDDFLPYLWPVDDCYWTGFYTSRPALKAYSRKIESIVRAGDVILSLAKTEDMGFNNTSWNILFNNIQLARRTSGILQHHDAMPGTARARVVDDYFRMLNLAEIQSQYVITQSLISLLKKKSDFDPYLTFNSSLIDQLTPNNVIAIIVYNSLAFERSKIVNFPISRTDIQIIDTQGSIIPSQINNIDSSKHYEIFFPVQVPALGCSTYYLVLKSNNSKNIEENKTIFSKEETNLDDISIENEYFQLIFDSSTKLLSYIINKSLKTKNQFQQQFYEYWNEEGSAYVFRPWGAAFPIFSDSMKLSLTKGPLFEEVRQYYSDNLTQIVRLYKGERYIEVISKVGPIEENRNFITRYSTDLNTNSTIFTDDNGSQFMERKYKSDTSIGGNYYPNIFSTFIRDNNLQFSVLTKHPHGVASLQNGQLELMLHRRLVGDWFPPNGLNEILNDTVPVVDMSWLLFEEVEVSSSLLHRSKLSLNYPLEIIFGLANSSSDWNKNYETSYKPLQNDLPINVHLLSLKCRDKNKDIIFRLHHLYGKNESKSYSQPVQLDLTKFFNTIQFTSGSEMSLTCTIPKSNLTRWHWNYQQENKFNSYSSNFDGDNENLFMNDWTLKPQQIKTFLVSLKSKKKMN